MITFHSHSGIHTLIAKQKIPIEIEKAWDFISSPENLKVITPNEMDFNITSPSIIPGMHPGQIISYTVSPFKGIRSNWVTEITHVSDQSYFVDEQRFGPYSMWHHEHWIRSITGGIEMIDKVSYKVPFGILGQLVNKLVIKNKLKGIFEYRFLKIVELFGPFEN